MRGSALLTEKTLLLIILLLLFSVATIAVGTTQTIPTITQTNSTITVYLDPPSITGVTINETFTINITIRDALEIRAWQTGLIFNATALNCTGFFQGEFLKSVGTTSWYPGSIDNEAGVIEPYGCTFLGDYNASGTGQLAYVTFKVKAPGISDIHLRDIKVTGRIDSIPYIVQINIVDVYTVVVNATPHKVVTVSNSYGATGVPEYHSGFYDHAFSIPDREIRFKATNPINTPPISRFSNVTIPETLVSVESPDQWKVLVNGAPVNRTVTYNGTHYFIYFAYSEGVHTVQITSKRDLAVSLDAPTVTLSYLWMPDSPVTVNYNVTVYAPPVTGEAVIDNNVATKFVRFVVLRELVVSLDAQVFLGLGDSSLLNATVYNFGWKNETDVELQMFINGVEVNSTIITLLQVGYNYTLSYFWSPPAVEESYNVTVYAPPVTGEAVIDNNVATKFVMVGQFFVDPSSGPIGTKTTFYGANFPNQTQVLVTFNDMPMGSVTTDQDGSFIFVFNIPVSVAGEQTVKAIDVSNVSNYVVRTFTVIDVTPLDIETEVGSIHFRGEMAEFYIQIAFKGTLVDATITRAMLYCANGTMSLDLKTNVESISTGLYRIPYLISANATLGSYILTIEASYAMAIVEAKGVSSKSFLLSPTLTVEDALIIDIKDEIATIIIPNLDLIKANLTAINAELVGLNGTIVTINSTLGLLQTDIDTINLKVTAIVDDIATIQTTLNTIEGKITSIEGGTATIETDIGSVKADVSTIKGTQETFVIPQYATVALALIAAIGAVLIIILLHRKPKA